MTSKTYQVHYIAGDGTMQSFKFKTDRSMQRVNRNDGFSIPTPFMQDMCAAAKRYESNPDSHMSKHGGFMYTHIKRIKCVDTGSTRLFI